MHVASTDHLRIGVVGTGFGQHTARVFQAHERAVVTALCGQDPVRTASVAGNLGIPHAFSDYQQMIAAAPIDAVAIVTPPHVHRAVAEVAISHGKHVLCAKPLAESLNSARAMLDSCARGGVVHGMDQTFRTIPESLYLKDLLDGGAVGRPHSVVEQVQLNVWDYYAYRGGSPSKTTWFTEPTGGGFLLATAQHFYDRLLWLFGPVRAASGSVRIAVSDTTLADGSLVRTRAPDSTHAHIEFSSGVIALTQLAPARWGQHRTRLEILGDAGALLLAGPAFAPVLQYAGGSDGDYQPLTIPERYTPAGLPQGVEPGPFTIADRFVRAILDGEPMSPTFEDGLCTQELMESIARSDESGVRQELATRPSLSTS
jgi:predicted dehydrogenase